MTEPTNGTTPLLWSLTTRTLCQNITNGIASAKDVENLTISEICDDVLPEKVRFEPMDSGCVDSIQFLTHWKPYHLYTIIRTHHFDFDVRF